VHELDARPGWLAAGSYLDMSLTDRVHRDASFADYDRNMIDSATRPSAVTAAHGLATTYRGAPAVSQGWCAGLGNGP